MYQEEHQGGIEQIVIVCAGQNEGEDQKSHHNHASAIPPAFLGQLFDFARELDNGHSGTLPSLSPSH